MSRVSHNALDQDMCHGIIGSGVIKIESQRNQSYSVLKIVDGVAIRNRRLSYIDFFSWCMHNKNEWLEGCRKA